MAFFSTFFACGCWQGLTKQIRQEYGEDNNLPSRVSHFLLPLTSKRRLLFSSMDHFYEPGIQLGSGACGIVTRHLHKQTQSYRAVKAIKWANMWDSSADQKRKVKLIERELKAFMELDNPYIVKMYEWFEDANDGIFFVMEYCYGGTLEEWLVDDVCQVRSNELRYGFMPRLQQLFRHIGYAVAYLHCRGIIHCDLKPANVMIASMEPEAPAKLIDFGLSVLKEGQDLHCRWGTVEFMAPELFSPLKQYTTQCDVWALGIIFVWMITAVQNGKLMHPFLPEGQSTLTQVLKMKEVELYRCLLKAYRNEVPWNRSIFDGMPTSTFHLADLIFCHNPLARTSAEQVLRSDWVREGDKASIDILKEGGALVNIKAWPALKKFDKTVLHVLAHHVQDHDKQVIALVLAFRALDINNDGRLSKGELKDGFELGGVDISTEELQGIFATFDCDESGAIDFSEWLAATIGRSMICDEDAIDTAFHALDFGNTGSIDFEDLVQAIGFEEAVQIQSQSANKIHIGREDFGELVKGIASNRDTLRYDCLRFSHGRHTSVSEASTSFSPGSCDSESDSPSQLF